MAASHHNATLNNAASSYTTSVDSTPPDHHDLAEAFRLHHLVWATAE